MLSHYLKTRFNIIAIGLLFIPAQITGLLSIWSIMCALIVAMHLNESGKRILTKTENISDLYKRSDKTLGFYCIHALETTFILVLPTAIALHTEALPLKVSILDNQVFSHFSLATFFTEKEYAQLSPYIQAIYAHANSIWLTTILHFLLFRKSMQQIAFNMIHARRERNEDGKLTYSKSGLFTHAKLKQGSLASNRLAVLWFFGVTAVFFAGYPTTYPGMVFYLSLWWVTFYTCLIMMHLSYKITSSFSQL